MAANVSVYITCIDPPQNMFTKQKKREGKYVPTIAKDGGPHEFPGVWRRPNLNIHGNTAWASLMQVTSPGSRKNKGWKNHLGNCLEIHISSLCQEFLLKHGHVISANDLFLAPNLQWGQGFQTDREVRGLNSAQDKTLTAKSDHCPFYSTIQFKSNWLDLKDETTCICALPFPDG